MRRKKLFAASLTLLIAAAQPLNAAVADHRAPLNGQLTELAEAAMRKGSTPGLAIVIVDDRGVLWSGFYGVTAQTGAPINANTVFRVGSTAKPVTAAAVMRLVERGQVKLDEPVGQTLPSFTPRNPFRGARPITFRALLAHHSGLPSDILHTMWDKSPAKVCDALPAIASEWLVEPPQKQYRYSNLDYTALGCTIETVSHRPFTDTVRDELLTPLGMTASTFGEESVPRSRLALPHSSGKRTPQTELRDVPAGSLSATAEDMGRFVRMLLAGGEIDGRVILKPSTVASLFKRQFDDGGWPYAQSTGLGWMLSGESVAGAGDAVWHSGQYPGYFSHVMLLPSQRLGIVVLANDDSAREFVPKMAGRALELVLQAKTGVASPERAAPPIPSEVHMNTGTLERYVGRYAVLDEIIPVTRDGNRLALKFHGRRIELVPVGGDKFVPHALLALGLIDFPLDGLSVSMTAKDGHQFAAVDGMFAPLAFEKIEAGSIPDAWRKRSGEWRVVNPDGWLHIKSVRVDVNNDVLTLRVVASSPIWGIDDALTSRALRPLGDNLALTVSANFGGGAIEATTRNGRETLIYSGYVLQRAGEGAR